MSDQNQTLPRRSRRLATIIPASHWMSIGYSPEAAQAMESLQNDLKKYTINTLKLNPKYLLNSGREGIIAVKFVFNLFSYSMFTSARNTEGLKRRK